MSENLPIITDIKFYPKRPTEKGFIGFVSVLYDGRILLHDIAVYKMMAPEAGRTYRLVYPRNRVTNANTYHPIDKSTSKLIEREVNSYLSTMLGMEDKSC